MNATHHVRSQFDEAVTSLADIFEAGARGNAARPCLVVGGRSFSYGQIEDAARCLASSLYNPDLADPPRIGVWATRSWPSYVGILAAAMAGAAFVPLNPRFPSDRTRYMVERADLACILVDEQSFATVAALLAGMADPPKLVSVDRLTLKGPLHAGRPTWRGRDQLAYLLFTSGSTGQPKGVPISVANVASFLATNFSRYDFEPEDRFSQFFDLTFDPSIFDIFMAWGSGGALCVPSRGEILDPTAFVNDQQLTVWFSVPSLALRMLRAGRLRPGLFPSLRWSLFCGEALAHDIAEAWQSAAPNGIVENLYGPTELTVSCAVHRFSAQAGAAPTADGLVPIGRVYDGLHARLVDEQLKEVGAGDIGELCVAGPQTFGGYWRALDVAQPCFIEQPDEDGVVQRFYRTGDLVRRRPDGTMDFVGRRDTQVKISGYRIELGEVEACLRRAGCIEAVALPWPTRTQPRAVVAFVTGNAPVDTVLSYARMQLPKYMLPRRIDILDEMPLNANGKADRQSLSRHAAALQIRA